MSRLIKDTARSLNRAIGLFVISFAAIIVGANAFAVADAGEHIPVFTENGVAIRGTDAVAYFTQAKPVLGKEEFSAEYQGATWHFSSAENRETFLNDPEKYAPAYGGYCAYALSLGTYKVETDPDAWSIVNGRLYLNKTPVVRSIWETDVPGNIVKSEENWAVVIAE
ncbi:YHS domain-containing (seleno)protein [Parvibaculaceae bacterium PLY_AMNH_Bact1]|nr:YHS domain-containing (seleno)protein [Parvibaculaceae bacterium PLY_AMNH_Bact1]